jgi:hypothetical protein
MGFSFSSWFFLEWLVVVVVVVDIHCCLFIGLFRVSQTNKEY